MASSLHALTGRLAVTVVVALGAGVLGACGPGGSLAQQVREWATSSGWQASVSELRGDLGRLPAITSESAGVRRTACDVLVTDALNANEQLPTPDQALTSLLSKAYSAAADAGRHCYSGGPEVSAVPAEQQAAARALVQAQARYDELTSTLHAGRGAPGTVREKALSPVTGP